MDVHVLTETDVRQIIRDELNQTGQKAINRVRSGETRVEYKSATEAEPAQTELQTVRIAFIQPSGHIEQYTATPDVARQIADDFVSGRVMMGSYLVKRIDHPCILALNFNYVLRID
jgi:hypothetical protein